MQQVEGGGPLQAGRIDQHQHIGGGVFAFLAKSLNQAVILGLEQLHLDARFGGELLIELLIAVVMAAGIDADAGFFGMAYGASCD